jgi:hypothetical protein
MRGWVDMINVVSIGIPRTIIINSIIIYASNITSINQLSVLELNGRAGGT